MSKSFAPAEVSKHKDKDNGIWLIIEGNVYDVTSKYMETASAARASWGRGGRALVARRHSRCRVTSFLGSPGRDLGKTTATLRRPAMVQCPGQDTKF